jgi:hypothetical protein
MPFPESSRLELPILQELKVTGGADQLRYLYDRLIRYFPQLTIEDLAEQTEAGRSRWHRHVQRAGRQLEERGELRRERTRWMITPRGAKRVEAEAMQVERNEDHLAPPKRVLTHQEAQAMLVEIGEWLGYVAAQEFERYDVVWRESPTSPRLSHVFEVQISGSVDSALARLKHAYDTQRSRPFLVIAEERDTQFARKRLTGSFHEIWRAITVIGVGELARLHAALKTETTLLAKLSARD